MSNGNSIRKRALNARVGGVRIPISVYETGPNDRELVLIIYGGSTTMSFGQRKCWRMKKRFAEAGFSAASFDFRGSIPGTEYFKAGLCTRLEDARAALDRLKREYPTRPITILGVSMGGYLATFFANEPVVKRLILIAPAAYHKDAMAKKLLFGPAFSALIRTPESWKQSDSFDNVLTFHGSMLVIRFGEDEVVPQEIPALYYAWSDSPYGETRTLIDIVGYGHKGNWDGPKFKEIMDVVIPWLKERTKTVS
ncbi:MAG: alpha/beta fold hydrolase [bacterium]|nr:alpha/beta fold hydrolase [bacterium]